MSRIGNKSITIPKGVEFKLSGRDVSVKGPKTKTPMTWTVPAEIVVKLEDGTVTCARSTDAKKVRALHGLTRALLNNMVVGASEGFTKKVEIYGIGYNVAVNGRTLVLSVGYNAPREFTIPDGVEVTIEAKAAKGNDTPAKMTMSGPDKHILGQFFATVRRIRPPEPYKGKGIRLEGEQIVRKEGKSFVSGG